MCLCVCVTRPGFQHVIVVRSISKKQKSVVHTKVAIPTKPNLANTDTTHSGSSISSASCRFFFLFFVWTEKRNKDKAFTKIWVIHIYQKFFKTERQTDRPTEGLKGSQAGRQAYLDGCFFFCCKLCYPRLRRNIFLHIKTEIHLKDRERKRKREREAGILSTLFERSKRRRAEKITFFGFLFLLFWWWWWCLPYSLY